MSNPLFGHSKVGNRLEELNSHRSDAHISASDPIATWAVVEISGINKKTGWHARRIFSTLSKSLGVGTKIVQELLRPASCRTTMAANTQALEEPKRQTHEQLAALIMPHRRGLA